jgi:hypothetical protein
MASAKTAELPEGFLDGPAPNLTKHVVDFSKEGLQVYRDRWAVILDGVLSPDECELLTKAAEVTTGGIWERVSHSYTVFPVPQAHNCRRW